MPKPLILLSFVALFFYASIQAKEFRGIIPLHSSREDVVRLLGNPAKKFDNRYFYKSEKDEVVIWFSEGSCDDFGFNWNVPAGIVTSVAVVPFKKLSFAELNIDEKKFESSIPGYNLGFIYLSNEIEGYELETLSGFVTTLMYKQKEKESDKRCPTKRECCFDFFPQDEFFYKNLNQTKARLDISASNYSQESDTSRMYLIVESQSETKARQTAVLAKKYLVKDRKFNPNHIIIANGKGMFSEANKTDGNKIKIAIWVKPIGGIFSRAPYTAQSIRVIEDETVAASSNIKKKIPNRIKKKKFIGNSFPAY